MKDDALSVIMENRQNVTQKELCTQISMHLEKERKEKTHKIAGGSNQGN